VPPQWATKAMNRATADNQSAQSEEEGLEPTKEWVKDLIDEIVTEEFASPDLELHWLDEDEGDPETVLEGRLKVGALTLNEMRDALGLDPFDNAAADRPMVLTATGFVPIEANAGGEGTSTSANGEDGKPHAAVVQKYSPDQPRVPAGNPDGGQWQKGDGGGGSFIDSRADTRGMSEQRTQYAALEAKPNGTQTDATPSGDLPSNDHRYAATQVTVYPSAVTHNLFIDGTTAKLTTILVGIMNGLERAPGISSQQYGRLVHEEFADAVVAAVLPGIAANDVETTFPEGLPYGSTNSIRTDVVLRDDSGTIVAIYDVKTGRGLEPSRVDELRTKTRASPDTPVIELRFEGPVLKIQFAGLGSAMEIGAVHSQLDFKGH
jgi:hypothetical protein